MAHFRLSRAIAGRAAVLLFGVSVAVGHTTGAAPLSVLDREAFVQEVFERTNLERERANLAPLRLQETLGRSAEWMAADMARHDYFSHNDRYGRSFSRRIQSFGYGNWRLVGENLAYGYRTPAEVVEGWMKSPGHRRNILDRGYTEIGIAVTSDPATNHRFYWVQNFGARR
jgi:uncharacterized protein YkwD